MLAAGAGSRFAGTTHKLLADFRGRPLVTWAVSSALAASIGAVAVVTGAVDLAGVLPREVELVANPNWADGQATSLGAAIGWARDAGLHALVVGLGDQPMVPAAAWAAVAAARTPLAVATFGGRRRPPVRLARAVWPLVPTEGDRGARALMARMPDLVGEVPCPGDPADIDQAEDLARYR